MSLALTTVAVGLIEHHGLCLACQRRHDTIYPLRWEFPGGKLEDGENIEQALKRELREELGIEAEIGIELHRARQAYPEDHALDLVYHHITAFTGEVKNLAFRRILWMPAEELATYNFLPGAAQLIQLINQGTVSLPPTRQATRH